MRIAIIKYNAGNVQSVQYALQRLGVTSIVTDNENEIRNASKVIFPYFIKFGHRNAKKAELGMWIVDIDQGFKMMNF